MRAKMILSTIGLLLVSLLAACSSNDAATGQVAASPATATPPTVDHTSVPTPASNPEPTRPASSNAKPQPTLTDAQRFVPAASFDLPPTMFVLDVVNIERPVVLGQVQTEGGPIEVLWRADEPFDSAVAVGSLFPDQEFPPTVSDLVHFKGRYFAFVMGHDDADASAPTLVVSDNGRDWDVEPMSPLNLPIRYSSPSSTPSSPPWPGMSGVSAATTNGREMYATGWSTVDGEVVPTFWIFEGGAWLSEEGAWLSAWLDVSSDLSDLYGSQLGIIGGSWSIVRIGGPLHSGVSTLTLGVNGWQEVENGDDLNGRELVAANNWAFYRLVFPEAGDATPVLLESGDTLSWDAVALPNVPDADPNAWQIEGAAHSRPHPAIELNVWQDAQDNESLTIYTLDHGYYGWRESTASGTRVAGSDHTLFATQDQTTLYLVDRRDWGDFSGYPEIDEG